MTYLYLQTANALKGGWSQTLTRRLQVLLKNFPTIEKQDLISMKSSNSLSKNPL